jgi:hypothetical protein
MYILSIKKGQGIVNASLSVRKGSKKKVDDVAR